MDSACVLNTLDMFKHIKPKTMQKLALACSVKNIKKGEHLFFDKQKCQTLFIVLTGMVSIYKLNQQNDKKVLFVFNRNKFINEEILYDYPVSCSCEALEKSTIICIPKHEFLTSMQDDFELTKIIIGSFSIKVRRMYRQLKNASGTVRLDKKLAAKLWKLSQDFGVPNEQGTLIDLDLSVTFLAEMLGSKRESISRQLKVLSENGLVIVKGKKYIIVDTCKLSQYFKS